MVGALDNKVDEHAQGDRATPGLDLLLRLLHEVGWEEKMGIQYRFVAILLSTTYLLGAGGPLFSGLPGILTVLKGSQRILWQIQIY